jgi:hypothetical protein
MSAIGPGDFLECIEPLGMEPDTYVEGDQLRVGSVHLVRAASTVKEEPCVLLVGSRLWSRRRNNEGWFKLSRFRPFQGPEQESVKARRCQPAGAPT